MRKPRKPDLIFLYLMAGMGGFNAFSTWGMTVFPVLAIAGGLYALWSLHAKNNLSRSSDS